MVSYELATERLRYYRTGMVVGFIIGALAVIALVALGTVVRP